MWRAVVDTNLIVSGTVSTNSIPYYLLQAWRDNDYVLVTSPHIIYEVADVLTRPQIQTYFSLTNQQIKNVILSLKTRAFVTPGILRVDVVKPDPDDNAVIAAALEGSATHIVTGDRKHLLPIKKYQGIQIVTAREFLQLLS